MEDSLIDRSAAIAQELRAGRRPDLHGALDPFYVYIRERMGSSKGRSELQCFYSDLLAFADTYRTERFVPENCLRWSYQCLMALGNYETFLDVTQPDNLFSINNELSNLRCNVQHFLRRPAHAVDLFKMYGYRGVTGFVKDHPTEFKAALEEAFGHSAKCDGPWFERILAANRPLVDYQIHLFTGQRAACPNYCFYHTSKRLTAAIYMAIRQAENAVRLKHGVGRVGEYWIEETRLFNSLQAAFPEVLVIHHGSPDWLGRQHLDIWIPEWQVGVEYHGVQHFAPAAYFGGEASLEKTQARDHRKAQLCGKHGTELIIVRENTPLQDVLDLIRQKKRPDPHWA